MTNKIDFRKAAEIGLSKIKEWLPTGKQKGDEWSCLNPTRDDKTIGSFSVNTKTGAWGDFATGEKGGDAVSLYAYLNKLSNGDAAKKILDSYGTGYSAKPTVEKPKTADWEPIYPVPEDAGIPEMRDFELGKPSMHWVYRNDKGQPLFYVARYDLGNGQKEIKPWSYCKHATKGTSWRQKSHPTPRPLYNLQNIIKNPDAPILVVEGEKCADAASSILKKYVVTTWPNGAPSVSKTNWSVLSGRTVIVWPDNDHAGRQAAGSIFGELRGDAKSVFMIRIPDGKPVGWDIADAIADGMTETELLELIEPEEKEIPPPFRALGHDCGTYYFLSGRTQDVISIPSSGMKKAQFLSLAPLQYWEVSYPNKTGPEWDVAADALIGMCQRAGKYDPDKVRGRGAWFDDGKIVLHLGNRILCEDKISHLHEFKSKWIYEIRPNIGVPEMIPAKIEQSKEVLKIFSRLNWDRKIDGYLAAGWCALAPICGSLNWRPHVWLTGPSGSGKSWIMDNMIQPLLGSSAVCTLGKSTEAGIRQQMQNDALPVVIDEAESDDEQQAGHIQSILTLMRQSSSGNEYSTTKIFKGTTSGRSSQFTIRSCFLLSSIAVGTKHHADESRVTVLSLKVDRHANANARFKELQNLIKDIFTEKTCSAIRARAISLIPLIRKNSKTFSEAIAVKLGSKRLGDQIGALMAGAWSWHSDDEITIEDATEFLKNLDFRDEENKKEATDEDNCLQAIIQASIKVTVRDHAIDQTIGDLIARVSNRLQREDVVAANYEEADIALRRVGIRVDEETINFAYSHDGIRALLKTTSWGSNYTRMLRRITDATAGGHMRFSPGVRQRVTRIPLDVLFPKVK